MADEIAQLKSEIKMLGDDHQRQLDEAYKQGQIDQEIADKTRLDQAEDQIKALQQEMADKEASQIKRVKVNDF